MIMTIVLLLNLLIARLNTTFVASQQIATLEWRVMFARNVLKLEMLAEPFAAWCTREGGVEGPDGRRYVRNRVHDEESGYGVRARPTRSHPSTAASTAGLSAHC